MPTTIEMPDYRHYARLVEVNLQTAGWLIASAQLLDSEFESEDDYNSELSKLSAKVRGVLIQSISNDQLEARPLIDGFTVMYDELNRKSYSLNEIYIEINNLCEWAVEKEYYLPSELLRLTQKKSITSEICSEKSLRPNQLAKAKCQAIAKTLWHNYPKLTTAEIIKRYEILEFGDGKMYPGKNTLRDWVSEVDPRQDSEKTGPKKVTE